MDHARRAIETWREEYNAERPHSSLADLTPNEYARRLAETAEQKVSLAADSACAPDQNGGQVKSVCGIGVEPWDNVREGKRHEQRHNDITTVAA
jgi:hypothetical protein